MTLTQQGLFYKSKLAGHPTADATAVTYNIQMLPENIQKMYDL